MKRGKKCTVESLENRTLFSTLPTGFSETAVARGLINPTAMSIAPDGRLFVSEQAGSLRVVKNGQLLSSPFMTLTVNNSGERGLLGTAFDPDFASNHFIYVYYTATTPAVHNRVSRFTANGDVVVAGSEKALLDLPNLTATNHNGGALAFGKDGKLYISTGENAVGSNAQSLSITLGKILRINSDGSIPTDNPFYGSTTGINRSIWALGLRNPYTFAFQNGTGRFFINDVGQDTWEEINDGIAGSNYGWPTTEGYTSDPQFRQPIYAYNHGVNDADGVAITGGTFYNPATANFPQSFVGKYFYSDYGVGFIHLFDPATDTSSSFATGAFAVDLDVDSQGHLLYLTRNDGSGTGAIFQISADPNIGTGLQAYYYNNTSLSGSPVLQRVDSTVNFNNGTGSPAPGKVNVDNFSVRWLGSVQPQFTQTYTFHTFSDDGVRLWVNNQQIINNWTNHGGVENTGSISLVAGQKYSIRMEYFEGNGTSISQLLWSSPSTPKQVIPSTQLYPHLPQTLQAEAATVFGAGFKQDHTGYTGTGFIDYVNNNNDYVEFTFNQDVTTPQELDFRFANGTTTNRVMKLTEDGVSVGNITFGSTGNWDTWKIASVVLNLTAGTHKVRLTAAGTSGPNLDSLTVI